MEMKKITKHDLYKALYPRFHLLCRHLRSALETAGELQNFLKEKMESDTSFVDEADARFILDSAATIANLTQKSHRDICEYGIYESFLDRYCAETVYQEIIYKADGIKSVFLREENVVVVTSVLLPSKSNKKVKSLKNYEDIFINTTDLFAKEIAKSIRNTLDEERDRLDFGQVKQGDLAVYYCYNYDGLRSIYRAADATNHYTDQMQNSVLLPFGGDSGTTRVSFENFFLGDAKEGTYIIVSLDGNKIFSDADIIRIIRKTQ